MGPTAAEPKSATHEEASASAQLCTKCLPRKDGPKGCRACMGELFEVQRKRGFLARSAKDLCRADKNLGAYLAASLEIALVSLASCASAGKYPRASRSL
eukprot:5399773-Pyramimonas_sp.AAC.1